MAKKQKIQTAEEFTANIRNGLLKQYVNDVPAYTRDAKTDLVDQYMQLRELRQTVNAENQKKTMEGIRFAMVSVNIKSSFM